MRRLIQYILLVTATFVFSQKEIDSNVVSQIRFLKSKKVSKLFNSRAKTLVYGKDIQRVIVRCVINPNNKDFDINAFSLVDRKNKVRYRLSDVSAYYTIGGPKIKRYWREQPFDKKGKPVESFYATYDDTVIDSFTQDDFENFYLSESTFSFTSGQKVATYFGLVKAKKKFTTDLYFVLNKKFLKIKEYELYHGTKKITNVSF